MVDVSLQPAQTGLLPALTLVLGGARSGKSRHAEALVLAHADAIGAQPVYIATAEADDSEMAERIAKHKARRSDHWRNREVPLAIAEVISGYADTRQPILIDCLTLWLGNILLAERDIAADIANFLNCLASAPGPIVCVANEVGLGIVPEYPLGRSFRDYAGRLNQQVAEHADRVDFIAAGLPISLKQPPNAG